MNSTASNFTGSVPEYYESGLVPVIFDDFAKDLANRVARQKPKKVLELAAGTGVVTRKLRDLLAPDARIIASDLNMPMLEVAQKKFTDQENVSFETVDAMDLSLGDNTIDVVACQFGVMFFPDKVQSYREARRVLKPGGQYIFSLWGSHDENPFARITQSVVEDAFPEDPPGFYKVPFHYHDPKEIAEDVKAAGFSEVNVERKVFEKKVPSMAAFLDGLVKGNPIIEEILARGGDPEVFRMLLEKAFASEFQGESPVMPLCIYVVTVKE
jgi:ubiquinone/menaquinone biosynthesis C-methylase UbiE